MTLFDGQPLTEQEIAARLLCECSHSYGTHCDGWECLACDCEEFVEAAEVRG